MRIIKKLREEEEYMLLANIYQHLLKKYEEIIDKIRGCSYEGALVLLEFMPRSYFPISLNLFILQ